ncbi:WxL protein host-binding domain-containing protein [Companilactobacillus mishanensis]|uniref:DUF3324 domain-containing protein n=1 Tax=Companilactobacillus mishanensis TaxID=2486008 RepID=A0A5P0ZHF0_9LACO|nr:DUF3324 domain-containing protein [Companilactobacillus mishanensis]MQS52490.1 DUF3324 domain-containing protein [Companilactobacillus mishanensis]
MVKKETKVSQLHLDQITHVTEDVVAAKMKSRKALFILVAIVAFILAILMNVDPVKADIRSVSVTPLIDNAEMPDRFVVKGNPGSVTKLKLSVTNFGDMPIKLRVEPTNATTSMDGKIDFSQNVEKGNYGLKVAFADMTEGQTVKLKINQTKDLTFAVRLPDDTLEGTVIGGFNVFDVDNPNDGSTGVGVYLNEGEPSTKGDLKINDVTPKIINEQPHIVVNLVNDRAVVLKNVTVQIRLKKNNWYNKLGIDSKEDITDVTFAKIAPNSKIPLEFNQKQSPIQAGNYWVEGKARSASGTWNFKKNLTITAEQANNVNTKAKDLIYDKTVVYLLIIGVLTSLIILIFWGIWYQRR